MDEKLPDVVSEYIESVIKKMRYKKKVRAEVRAELAGHFADALKECVDENKEQTAKELIEGFGDARMLAVLIRRGKKRNRPLWKKAIIKTLQVIGILILFVLLRVGYMSIGEPTITVDYSQWLTEKASGGKDESLNAMMDIIKATELLSDQYTEASDILKNWPGDMSDEELELTRNYVQVNEAAIDKFIEALEKPYCWADYQVNEIVNDGPFGHSNLAFTQEVMAGVMPRLNKYKRLAQRMQKRILLKAYDGDIDGAVNDAMVLHDFGSRQVGKGLLIEQLVGIAIEALGHHGLYIMLDRAELSAEQLKDIQYNLAKQFAKSEGRMNFKAEKAFLYDMVQRSFTDDGTGSGRVLPKGIPLAATDWKSGIKILFGIGAPDRREVLKQIDSFYDNVHRLLEGTPWQSVNEPLEIGWDNFDSNIHLMEILGSSFGKVSELSWRLRSDRDGLITTIAVFRFEKNKGSLPVTLGDVVEAGYLKSVPMDPFSNGHLLYKQADDGFVLYSAGPDLIDDDGHIMRYENGRVRQWPKGKGDAIFWPRRSMAGEVIVVKPQMMGPMGKMGPMGGSPKK